ncbi:hypothetical protein GOBAR_AA12359 [Gossypium barbadense]|uniref:Uncharacterized protein n=1 Tax=Gossypium barbadense TaxID=3634 RepID=A0A2P5XY49_GOSBA|nr:hypothetical protein GOBAR_AA12359 [Gossypium barbadense]
MAVHEILWIARRTTERGVMEPFTKAGWRSLIAMGQWFTWERGRLPENNVRERLDRGWPIRLSGIFVEVILLSTPSQFFQPLSDIN